MDTTFYFVVGGLCVAIMGMSKYIMSLQGRIDALQNELNAVNENRNKFMEEMILSGGSHEENTD